MLAAAGLAQNPDPYAKARAAIEQSVEKQRASVRIQVKAGSSDDAFFTVPWVAPQTETAAPPTQPDCEPVPEEQLGPLVEEISRREGLTPDLLRAVIQKESGFLPCAVSSKGAQGLMQLMPATASDLGVRDPFDPKQNIIGGVTYLKYLLDLFGGDLSLSLAAYNAGENSVLRFGGIPSFTETREYVRKVTSLYGSGPTAYQRKQKVAEPYKAPIYRYVDAQGRVHFTNVE